MLSGEQSEEALGNDEPTDERRWERRKEKAIKRKKERYEVKMGVERSYISVVRRAKGELQSDDQAEERK